MKVRKSEIFLVISSVHLGADQDILNVYKQVAKRYKAQVIHLGNTSTTKEINNYNRLQKLCNSTSARIDELENAALAKAESSLEEKETLMEMAREEECQRVTQLTKTFGKVKFVTNEKLSLSSNFAKDYSDKAEIVLEGLSLSKFLFLSAIPPSSERNVKSIISGNAYDFLKKVGKSWIAPHPTPIIDSMPRPGLNETYSLYTVGCLKHSPLPLLSSEFYLNAHMPCAVLVIMDKLNGEFHAKQLHIDYLEGENYQTRSCPAVLDDGLVFTSSGWKEVGSDDKATLSTDDHVPYTHAGSLGALRVINMRHKPGTFINAGDAGDFDPIGPHDEDKPGERENKRLVHTLNGIRRLFDAQTSVPSIKNRVLIDSNHHEWVTKFVMKVPALIGLLDWATLAKERFPDWKVLIRSAGEPEIYKFGDMTIRHGDRDNIRSGERIYDESKFVCGHYHRYATYRRAVQVGCGAALGPRYTEGSTNAWQNQVATLTKFNGITAINAKVVLHDKVLKVSRVAYRDEILECDHYEIFERDANGRLQLN